MAEQQQAWGIALLSVLSMVVGESTAAANHSNDHMPTYTPKTSTNNNTRPQKRQRQQQQQQRQQPSHRPQPVLVAPVGGAEQPGAELEGAEADGGLGRGEVHHRRQPAVEAAQAPLLNRISHHRAIRDPRVLFVEKKRHSRRGVELYVRSITRATACEHQFIDVVCAIESTDCGQYTW